MVPFKDSLDLVPISQEYHFASKEIDLINLFFILKGLAQRYCLHLRTMPCTSLYNDISKVCFLSN